MGRGTWEHREGHGGTQVMHDGVESVAAQDRAGDGGECNGRGRFGGEEVKAFLLSVLFRLDWRGSGLVKREGGRDRPEGNRRSESCQRLSL